MKDSLMRNKVIEEIKLIPDNKLLEVYDYLHYFRISLQKTKKDKINNLQFAGCWADMPEDFYESFLDEIHERRSNAFVRRSYNEASDN